ncbi:MAG: baseplate J/gp47 family protein [Anaerolineae bacterium]|nr:baseplate J/gp47 family protein [Anaerolineae bacterium]
MSLGPSPAIDLELHDDLASVRYRLDQVARGRVILVLPWDLRFLSRPLDFTLLRREAERRQLEVAIVSPDPERRALAHDCGFPSFATVQEAQESVVWRSRAPERVLPPPRHWWDEDISLRPRPVRPHPRWLAWLGLGLRFMIFLLVLAVLAGSAYAVVPSAAVTLVPAGREFTIIVPVSVSPDIEAIDHTKRLIPARRLGVYVSGYAETETTGTMSVIRGRATGTVLFTNLLSQDYLVPAGTVVRTSSSSYPLRFRTTADVLVPAMGQATAPIESLTEGSGGVAAFEINRVEGVAASAVRVINPEPTGGAEEAEVRVVTQADYDRVRKALIRQLFDQAAADMHSLMAPTEMLLRQSLRIEAVPKESYTRFLTEQADSVGLDMQLLVSGLAVDIANAKSVAYVSLSRRLPPGYNLVSVEYEVGEMAEEDIGPGQFTLFVTARGYAAVGLDTDVALDLIRGQPPDVATQSLRAQLPLAEEPQIVLWPEWPERLKWLERVPYLPLRIRVQVIPRGDSSGDSHFRK